MIKRIIDSKRKVMKYEVFNKGFKKGIIFLSGRGKKYDTWNVTENGKIIGLEENYRKRCNTCLVEFDVEDEIYYDKYIDNVLEPVDQEASILNRLIEVLDNKVKWFVVAHSYGSYFASLLPKVLIHAFILIDPVSVNFLTFKNFTVPIIVHLDIGSDDTKRISNWTSVTNYNNKSAVIVYYQIGHMIHWKQPGKIQNTLDNIL